MYRAGLVLLATLTAAMLPEPLSAQIPQRFTNLEVLPADIARPALIRIMRNITGSLGVRCEYCHVGGNPQTLEGVDFASDSLPAKRIARRMLSMVEAINASYLREVAPDSATRVEVTCTTCHRGVTRPEPLDRMMLRIAAADGLDAAVAEYRRLRERYYGSAAYNFAERTLISAAEQSGGREHALGFLALNLEFHPSSAPTYLSQGQIHLQAGDTASAEASFKKAVDLRPGDQRLLDQINRLLGR